MGLLVTLNVVVTSSVASCPIVMSIVMGKCSDQIVAPSAVGIPARHKLTPEVT